MAAQTTGLVGALSTTQRACAEWLESVTADELPRLLAVPDVGPTCEVLLADGLLGDLTAAERAGMVGWVRRQQQPDGSWRDHRGQPDLSLTALAWWARAAAGDDPEREDMQAALRFVHRGGGAQRGSFIARLWLALSGCIPWSWLPAIPSELWLLPPSVPFSAQRLSPWARSILVPYHLLFVARARLHLVDGSALLLRDPGGYPIPPRLTQPGLAGDLLQALDRTIKLSRRLPRGPLERFSTRFTRAALEKHQQGHGGWLSARGTLLSLLALRVLGARADDPRLRRGLDYLRRCRGWVENEGTRSTVQGLSTPSVELLAQLHLAAAREPEDVSAWLVENERSGVRGPTSTSRNGGWSYERGASELFDLRATCAALESLISSAGTVDIRATGASGLLLRALSAIEAMQEGDGGFARFERGESDVLLARLPWRDAELLSLGTPHDESRVALSARAIRLLARFGSGPDSSPVHRGYAWLRERDARHGTTFSTATVAELARCSAAVSSGGHAFRVATEARLRSRQREDGSFGSVVATAKALLALLELESPCVQAQRAATYLLATVEGRPSTGAPLDLGGCTTPGFGLTARLGDPSAGVREVRVALEAFHRSGGRVS